MPLHTFACICMYLYENWKCRFFSYVHEMWFSGFRRLYREAVQSRRKKRRREICNAKLRLFAVCERKTGSGRRTRWRLSLRRQALRCTARMAMSETPGCDRGKSSVGPASVLDVRQRPVRSRFERCATRHGSVRARPS
jgi:hypothetical protein